MAKLNVVDMVQGYADMSTEDKLKALEALTYDDRSEEIDKLKNAVTNANKEVSDWKKKHNALLSEDERKKQEDNEKLEQILAENKALKREKSISDFKATLIKQGYAEDLALSSATAMIDGDTETILANQEKFNEELKKKVIADAMAGTSYPAAGFQSGSTDYSKEILEAQARGDIAGVATYMRLQQEASFKKT